MPVEDQDILNEREEKLNCIKGPRVGDWLILANGAYTRLTHDWGDSLQAGGEGGSFYLGSGFCEYSGGLSSSILKSKMVLTGEKKLGEIWFFKGNIPRAHNGARFSINFRVYRLAALD